MTARDRAAAAEKAEATQRAQAEQNAFLAGKQATLALTTIQDLIVQVRTKLNGPNLFEVKTALLETALNRVDGVADTYEKSTSKEATALAALNELATIYRELGKSEKAFRLLEQCLAIAKVRVRIKDGSDPSRQNLANTYRDLGAIAAEYRRDMKASLAYNDEALKIWEDVFKNPKPDQWRLDKKIVRYFLAEAYTRVGVNRYNLGDIALARDLFRNAFQIRQQLVAESPDDPKLKQDLSYSTMALAESSFRLGDRPQADEYYRQTLDQRQRMFQETGKDPKVHEELSGVNYMIGVFKLKTGELAAARVHLQRCKELRVALVDADPKNAISRRNLGIVFYQLGNLADREKNEKGASEAFQSAREIQQKLADDDGQNEKRQYELMKTLAQVGRVEQAVQIADRLNSGQNVDNELLLEIACCYAQCARHTPADQAKSSQTYLEAAVNAIRKAIDKGFKDNVYIELEPDLDPLRSRSDFKALLARIGSAH